MTTAQGRHRALTRRRADALPSRRRRPVSAAAATTALGLLAAAALLAVATVVDLTDGAGDAPALGAMTILSGLTGAGLRRLFAMPARVVAARALDTVLIAWAALIGVATATYLVTGTFDRVDDALFESVSGFTTTALTIAPVEDLGRGILFWRAATQWLGGFAALSVIVAVLPFLGVGGPQATDAMPPSGVGHLRWAHAQRNLRRLFVGYALLSAVGVVLFLAAGLGPFDAVTYGMTTISTGGFANHPGSIGHFDSAVVEWTAIGGMALGGTSLALLLRGLRGRDPLVIRSAELRAYIGLLVIASGATAAWTVPSGGATHESIRHAVFSVVSAVSTTGHTVTSWSAWPFGAQLLVLALMGVGSMTGSLGGGFRIARALALVSYVWRELLRQLTPRLVKAVKVGRVPIDEDLVERMVGYQVLYLIAAGTGALTLAVTGVDLLTAVSGSVSALSTTGPALGDLGSADSAVGVTRPARLALVALMFAGRLELYPILSAVTEVAGWPRRALRRAVLVAKGGRLT